MLRNRASVVLFMAAVLTLVLSACGSPTPTITPQPVSTTVVPTETVAATAAATVQAAATTAPTTAAATTEVATTAAETTQAATAAVSAATQAVAAVPTTVPATEAPTTAPAVATPAATEAAVALAPTAVAAATTAATMAAETPAPAAAEVKETAPATQPSVLPQCASTGTLKVGSDAAYPPFENVNDKTGQIEGFDIDLINAIAQKAGFTVDVHNALFDTIFIALSYGQYDLVISAATITDERKKTVNFSDPYFKSGQVIVVRQADQGKVKTVDDLAGKVIGVQQGTTGAQAATEVKNVKDVKQYPTAPEALQALSNGDVDAVINDVPVSLNIILNSPNLKLVVAGQPFTLEYYGIVVRKDCTALLDAVNKGLQATIADGTYAKIYEKFFGEQPDPELRAGGQGIVAGTPAATAAAAGAATESAPAAAATEAAPAASTPAATAAS